MSRRARPMRSVSQLALDVREVLEMGNTARLESVLRELSRFVPEDRNPLMTAGRVLDYMRRKEELPDRSAAEEAVEDEVVRLLSESGVEAVERIVDRVTRKPAGRRPGRPRTLPEEESRRGPEIYGGHGIRKVVYLR